MDIESIQILSEKLQGLGFGASVGQKILQHVSFKPPSFTICHTVVKGKEVIRFHFFFQKNEKYNLVYYDAVLRKEIDIPAVGINAIDVRELDERMNIAWDKINDTDPEKIEKIVSDLHILGSTEEGKEIAERLQIKYWADSPVQQFITLPARTKFEISQRFYFFDNDEGISLEESYRFLNNRWKEKVMQKKKFEKNKDGENLKPVKKKRRR